jgi:hypothetical protein
MTWFRCAARAMTTMCVLSACSPDDSALFGKGGSAADDRDSGRARSSDNTGGRIGDSSDAEAGGAPAASSGGEGGRGVSAAGAGGTRQAGVAGDSSEGGGSSIGGTSSKGGATSSGGTASKGGTTSSGGTSSKGGTTSSGGRSSNGGLTAEGGSSESGGTTSNAGASNAGASNGGQGGVGGSTGISHPVAMYFMVDRSIASSAAAGGLNSAYVLASISAFVNEAESNGLDVGLSVFPAGDNAKADCSSGSDCGQAVIALTRLPQNAATFETALMAEQTTSDLPRPTECALRGMIDDCLQVEKSSQSGERCFGVLLTQGPPSQCDMTESDLEQILADGHMKGVDTFVLGMAGADMPTLNDYAMAGGTGMATDVSAGPTNYLQALNAIRDRVGR